MNSKILLQILADGTISASWIFGGITSMLLGLIWYNLTQFRNDVKTVLVRHDADIQEIKMHKADIADVKEIRESNRKTMHDLDKSIHELNITMTTLSTKMAIMNSED